MENVFGSQTTSFTKTDENTGRVKFFSSMKFFWLAAPWVTGGAGMIYISLPFLQNIHTENPSAFRLVFLGLIFCCAGIALFYYREKCDDYLIIDKVAKKLTSRIVLGEKVVDRFSVNFEEIRCITFDAEPKSGQGSQDTFWGCLVLSDGRKTQLTEKVYKNNFQTCLNGTKAVADFLECEFIGISEDAPVLEITATPGQKAIISHREFRFSDHLFHFAQTALIVIALTSILIAIGWGFGVMFGVQLEVPKKP